MAFVDPTQPGEEENQNPSQVDQAFNSNQAQPSQNPADQAPPSTSAGGAGVAAAGSGPTAGASSSPASSKPSSSGAWTNLDSYLKANSDQASTMGQQIASSVNAKGSQAQNDIGDLGSNFSSAVQNNTVAADQNAVNQAIQDASSLTSGQKLGDSDQAAFNRQANASYSGPSDVTGFNGYSQAQRDVNDATRAAQQTKTEAGRGTLLNDQYQNASKYGYTLGENNLDQLLLENSQGAQSALQPLDQQWSGLTGALNNTVSQGQNQVAQAQATDQATAAAAKNSLGDATANFQKTIQDKVDQLKGADDYSKLVSDLQGGTMSADEWKEIGVDPTAGQNWMFTKNATGTYVPDLSGYLSHNGDPTVQNVASADQYAQAAALAELAGQSDSNFLSKGAIDQAGTAPTTPWTFNSAQYTSANAALNTGIMNNLKSTFAPPSTGSSGQAYGSQPGTHGYTLVTGISNAKNLGDLSNTLNTAYSQYVAEVQQAGLQPKDMAGFAQLNGVGNIYSAINNPMSVLGQQ